MRIKPNKVKAIDENIIKFLKQWKTVLPLSHFAHFDRYDAITHHVKATLLLLPPLKSIDDGDAFVENNIKYTRVLFVSEKCYALLANNGWKTTAGKIKK